jgi:hypothetical protein
MNAPSDLRSDEEAQSVHYQQPRSKHSAILEQAESDIVRADVTVSILVLDAGQEEVERMMSWDG